MESLAKLIKTLRAQTSAGILDCKKALLASANNIEKAIQWLRENGISKAVKKSSREAREGVTKAFVHEHKLVIYELNCETDFVARNHKFAELTKKITHYLEQAQPQQDLKSILEITIDNTTLQSVIHDAVLVLGENIFLGRVEVLAKTQADEFFGLYIHNNDHIAVGCLFSGNEDKKIAKEVAMHVAAMDPQFRCRDDMPESFISAERSAIKKVLEKEMADSPKPEHIQAKILEGKLAKSLSDISLFDQTFVLHPEYTVGEFLKAKALKLIKMIRFAIEK